MTRPTLTVSSKCGLYLWASAWVSRGVEGRGGLVSNPLLAPILGPSATSVCASVCSKIRPWLVSIALMQKQVLVLMSQQDNWWSLYQVSVVNQQG